MMMKGDAGKQNRRSRVQQHRITDAQRRADDVLEYPREQFIPWHKVNFWYHRLDDTQFVIHAGSVFYGLNSPATVAAQTRTITADYQYIALEFTYATGALVIGAPTTDEPVPDKDTYIKWLFQFRLQNSRASIYAIGHPGGNIMIPGVWGPSQ